MIFAFTCIRTSTVGKCSKKRILSHSARNVKSQQFCRANRPDAQPEDILNTSLQSASDPLRQRFSLATHPRLPLLLVSDGYMVTALQIPGELNCLGLMKGLVAESTQQLKTLRDLQHLQVCVLNLKRLHNKIQSDIFTLKKTGGYSV